ncbi:MAG: tetratricopeptide repeat protein, partial [Kofleriaceae bacterium]|nr:tetratricopeptide repeat protein [Kofleriaceae bacterium]
CLYNLGRAYEQQGRVDDAAVRYGESLALRPNARVRAQLEALGARPQQPASRLPVDVCGPREEFSSVDALCSALLDGALGERERCGELALEGPALTGAGIRFVQFEEAYPHHSTVVRRLVAQVGSGWYPLAIVGRSEEFQFGNVGSEVEVVAATVRARDGAPPDAMLVVQERRYDDSGAADVEFECEERGLDIDSAECRVLVDDADEYDITTTSVLVCRSQREASWWCGWFENAPTDAQLQSRIDASDCVSVPTL